MVLRPNKQNATKQTKPENGTEQTSKNVKTNKMRQNKKGNATNKQGKNDKTNKHTCGVSVRFNIDAQVKGGTGQESLMHDMILDRLFGSAGNTNEELRRHSRLAASGGAYVSAEAQRASTHQDGVKDPSTGSPRMCAP